MTAHVEHLKGRQRTCIFLQVLTKPEYSVPSCLLCHMASGGLFLKSSGSCQCKMKAPRVSPVIAGAHTAYKFENGTKLHFESERTVAWHTHWGVTEQSRLILKRSNLFSQYATYCVLVVVGPYIPNGAVPLPPLLCLYIRQLPFGRGQSAVEKHGQ